MSFAPVAAVRDRFATPDFSDGFVSSAEPWLTEAIPYLRGEVMSRGFAVPQLRPEVCAVVIDDSFTVHYDGGLYHCLPMAGREECRSGHVSHGFSAPALPLVPDHWRHDANCPECEYLPLCYGGCKFAILQRTGAMTGTDCQRSFFARALPGLLLQDLRLHHPVPTARQRP